jgi:hypothetical protein
VEALQCLEADVHCHTLCSHGQYTPTPRDLAGLHDPSINRRFGAPRRLHVIDVAREVDSVFAGPALYFAGP